MQEQIKVLYMNGAVIKYNGYKELKNDYNILDLDVLDYNAIDKIIVAPSIIGCYKYLKVFFRNTKVEWFKQKGNTKDYIKVNIGNKQVNENKINKNLLGEEKEIINLVLDNKDVEVYYIFKQQELLDLEKEMQDKGYGDSYIQKIKRKYGANTIEEYIENLEEYINNCKAECI